MPLRDKSNDKVMVDDYWKKVKAKFNNMASERASNGSGSYAHLRQRSLSPYDPEGKRGSRDDSQTQKSSPKINPRHLISNLPEDVSGRSNRSRISGTPLSSHTAIVTNNDDTSNQIIRHGPRTTALTAATNFSYRN